MELFEVTTQTIKIVFSMTIINIHPLGEYEA